MTLDQLKPTNSFEFRVVDYLRSRERAPAQEPLPPPVLLPLAPPPASAVPEAVYHRIEELERYAATAVDTIRQAQADVHQAQTELAAVRSELHNVKQSIQRYETEVPRHDHGDHSHPMTLHGWVVINGLRYPVEIVDGPVNGVRVA